MKKILILVLSITCSISIFSQSTELLDEKNGFKSYKLGTLRQSLIQKGLILEEVKDSNGLYVVTNNKETKLFDYDVKFVHLAFNDENQLAAITITLEPSLKLGEVGTSFNKLFGKGFKGEDDKKQIPFEGWKGERVGLYVYYYPPFQGGADWQQTVFFYDLNEDRKKLMEGF